ncbi:uncharacterized protein LOC129954238 [Eupeodes corollae]|uniref:uncharacterized protein LOC129954238 n=1 Tax=Eupeodes corollae TaxID=290404 RepID=UPI0024920107|nr:uncharacterized protein LOC129954238 [Eupeodes corollae]
MPKSHSSKTDDPTNRKGRPATPSLNKNTGLQLHIPSSQHNNAPLGGDIGEFNCKSCNKVDDSYMVMCDKCDDWHHYSCVKVTSSISEKDWLCPKCSKVAVDLSKEPSVSGVTFAQKGDKTLTSEKKNEKTLSSSHGQQKSSFQDGQISVKNKSRSVGSTNSVKLSLKRLEEERILKKQRDQEYLDAKYALLEQLSDNENDDIDQGNSRLQDWVSEQSVHKAVVTEQVISPAPTHIPQSTTIFQNGNIPPNDTWIGTNKHAIPENRSQGAQRQNMQFPPSNTFPPEIITHSTGDALGPGHYYDRFLPSDAPNLNSQQIASRHIMHKELPSFSGRPEEWPLFISCFENSTRVCGLSNDENLIRLQKSLKGKALESVRAQLLYPHQLPNIISTLRMLFGRPEAIINSLVAKIRSEPSPKNEELDSLINFALSVRNIVATMETSGLHSHLNSPYLLQELIQKLPYQTKLNWGMYKVGAEVPVNLSMFSNWLYRVAEGACQVAEISFSKTSEHKNERKKSHNIPILNLHQHPVTSDTNKPDKRCVVCKGNCRLVEQCSTFKALALKEKWNVVNRNFLCRTCLVNHNRRRCISEKTCGVNGCTYKHHHLLHKYTESAAPHEDQKCNAHAAKENPILFKILPVTLYNNENQVHTYAFLDDGSSVSLIESKIAEELGLDGEKNPLCLNWTSGIQRSEEDSKVVNLQISGYKSTKIFPLLQVRTIDSLELPFQTMDFDDIQKRFKYLQGIPARSYHDIQPRILIGLDHCNLVNYQKIRESNVDEPVAVKTRLGWAVFGPHRNNKNGKVIHIEHISCFICDCQVKIDERLNELVKEYFQIENIGSVQNKSLMNSNDKKAQAILDGSTINKGKRYAVGLLWKDENTILPNNRSLAERRLICLEKQLKRNPLLEDKLNKQIAYYVEKGYSRKITKNELLDTSLSRIWYLPIFPVVNPNKPGKIRLVWDAAATYSGISLNSKLLTGPDTLPALSDVLFRFRQRKFAICGDIKEMFHQIEILESDQHAQRFLWRNKDTGRIEDYLMRVMTFGSTCSPYCAQYIKNKNASAYLSQHPRAVEAIIKNHYVDDYLDSLDTEEEAVLLAKEVISIHESGGFQIRNFISNSNNILEKLGDRSAKFDKIFESRKGLNESEKILGMWWSPSEDLFSFSCSLHKLSDEVWKGQKAPTKREILRTLMSIFDPLGLISNFLVLLKILLQEIWRSNVEWDEQIKFEHFQSWCQWLQLLPKIGMLKIRRPYLFEISSYDKCHVELHTFVDASMSAYAAVAYLRVVKGEQIECSLVASRTKVSPLKLISVPRLELEAAVLGVRLAKSIKRGHSVEIHKRYFWSDSKTALSWIKNDCRRFKQFVAFRVGDILEESNPKEWQWIPTGENIADEATKWNTKLDLQSDSRWYKGPLFLCLPEDNWPRAIDKFSTNEEVRVLIHQLADPSYIIDCERFSKWKRLKRSMAYMLRFVNLSRWGKELLEDVSLTPKEIVAAENFLYGLCQSQSFSKEWCVLKKNKYGNAKNITLEKSSPLYKTSPYMDSNNVIRIKGRIDAAEHVNNACKRPIILPNNHRITLLIIQDYHERFQHRFSETVVNEIRQIFFIPSLRATVKKVELGCQVCQIRKAKPEPPLMADLPPARLKSFTNPFSYVGVDYFGPMFVAVGRRLEKRWGVLFTCLTIRAIHIEVAHSLSSDSCILAIKRFCSRRGKPVELWSDNGTNFKGANQELKNAVASLSNSNDLSEKVMNQGINWKFIPPASPHMGGSWERLVRSVKEKPWVK